MTKRKIIWYSEYPEMEIYEDGTMELSSPDNEYDYRDLRNLLEKLSKDYSDKCKIGIFRLQ